MQLASLFVKVGLNGSDNVIAGLGKIKASSLAAYGEVMAVVTAMAKMMSAARDTAMALDKYVTFTGKSAQELQKLSFELGQTGVSMGQLQGALQSLEKQRTDMLLGKGYNPAFVLLGIDPRTDPVKMLEQIRDRVKQIEDPNVAKSLANQLGISDELYYSLLQDNKALDEFGKKLIMTDKEREGLVKMNREWQTLLWYIKQLVIKFGSMNTEWITDFVQAVINIVKHMGDWALRLSEIVRENKSLQIALIALTAFFQPVIAKVLVLIAVFEDFLNFLDGADSVIGRFGNYIDKYFGDYIRGAIELVKTLWNWLDKTFGIIDKVKKAWEDTKNSAGGQFVANMFEAFKMGVKEIMAEDNSSEGTNGFAHAFGISPSEISSDTLAPSEANISSVENRNVSVNNYNTFNGYSANELRPELVNLTEKDVSDARMESPELAGNI